MSYLWGHIFLCWLLNEFRLHDVNFVTISPTLCTHPNASPPRRYSTTVERASLLVLLALVDVSRSCVCAPSDVGDGGGEEKSNPRSPQNGCSTRMLHDGVCCSCQTPYSLLLPLLSYSVTDVANSKVQSAKRAKYLPVAYGLRAHT